MLTKPPECQDCYLCNWTGAQNQHLTNIGLGFSHPDGKGNKGVVAVGESLGYDELLDGLPFRPRAQAGSMLQKCVKLANIERDDLLFWNVVACKPPNNELEVLKRGEYVDKWYTQSALENCSQHFERVVGGFKPRVGLEKTLLALGNIPLRYLTNVTGKGSDRQSITHLRGYVFKNNKYGWVVPGLHPSFLKRGKPQWTPLLISDIKKAIRVANGSYNSFLGGTGYITPSYNLRPSLDECRSFLNRCRDSRSRFIGYDIETEDTGAVDEDEKELVKNTQIVSVQFSLAKGEGMFVPWEAGYIPYIKAILENTENMKVGFNCWFFDDPILEKHGVVINKSLDLMWVWAKLHPELPRNLQSVASWVDFPMPWKHLVGSKFEFYGCCDVDALQWITPKVVGAMKEIKAKTGITCWDGFKGYVWDYYYGVTRPMSRRGMPVSEEKICRLEIDLRKELGEVDEELQEMIPLGLKNVGPRRNVKEGGEEN
jgi:uracil-DNA glycosylase family 4